MISSRGIEGYFFWIVQGPSKSCVLAQGSALPSYELYHLVIDTYLRCSWKKIQNGDTVEELTLKLTLLRESDRDWCHVMLTFMSAIIANKFSCCLESQCQAADLLSTVSEIGSSSLTKEVSRGRPALLCVLASEQQALSFLPGLYFRKSPLPSKRPLMDFQNCGSFSHLCVC